MLLNPLKKCVVLVTSNTSSNMIINLYAKSLHSTEDDALVGRVAKEIKQTEIPPVTTHNTSLIK
jgi:phage-related baseplate assembly protein